MKNAYRGPMLRIRSLLVVCALSMVVSTRPAMADIVTEWSATAHAAVENLDAYTRIRAETLASIAVFNALNAIDTRYRFYGRPIEAASGTPGDVAVAAAAYGVLAAERGARKDVLDAAYDAALKKVDDASARSSGVAVGRAAATQILVQRAGDQYVRLEYAAREVAAGVWEATPGYTIAGAATFKTVRPLAIESAASFDPGPPPAVGSEQAIRDLVETRSLGRRRSTMRTADQSEAAYFWNTQMSSFDRNMVERIAKARNASPVETARMLALIAIAHFDAGIVGTYAKDKYRYWRPYNAIRGKFADPEYRDDSWEPLALTPSSPDWPSSVGQDAGVYEVLFAAFAADTPIAWSYRNPQNDIERSWPSLQAMADELSQQRIWVGVHFRSATTAGRIQGREVAAYVLTHALQPR